uniref:Uncharacterized protein n=1 Tax=Ditylenchus dipsaci TaxID=166011 RepID=A0A915DJR6_9BILA
MDKQCYHNGLVNGDRMKQSMEILPELLITKELSQLVNEGDEADTLGYSTLGLLDSFGQLFVKEIIHYLC